MHLTAISTQSLAPSQIWLIGACSLCIPQKRELRLSPWTCMTLVADCWWFHLASINNVLLTTYAYCIMWMVHDWNMYTLWLLCFIINAPYRSNFVSIHDFLVSHWKNWPFSRSYFSSWGHSVVAIVVVETFKQQSLYGLSLGLPKVAIGGLTVPTCTAFLCTVDKTLIRPDWMNPTNPILNLSSKVISTSWKKEKKWMSRLTTVLL